MKEQKREELKNKIIEMTQGKLGKEQINAILDRVCISYDTEFTSKIEHWNVLEIKSKDKGRMQDAIIIMNDPTGLAPMCKEYFSKHPIADTYYTTKQEVSVIEGDVKPVNVYDTEANTPDFTLNKLQIICNSRVDTLHGCDAKVDMRAEIAIYIPKEEFLEKEYSGVTSYKEFVETIANKGDEASLEGIKQEMDVIREEKAKEIGGAKGQLQDDAQEYGG
ncbi:MAG: hypothetical protein K2H53_00370 [Clostridia bacterium]|nr:hypothetical protein [Clostridia bacterium]